MKKTEIGTLAAALVMAGVALAGDLALPEGYTRLEWIESTGSQYIDTGAFLAPGDTPQRGRRWSLERAREWGRTNPWYCGFNHVPANAINDVEIWAKETFSPDLIRSEFKLATGLGFNCVRIFLQYKVYEADPAWFLKAFEQYLALADEAKLKVMPVLFDDCTFWPATDPQLGKQTDPFPGWGMWGWVPSPGHTMVVDYRTHGALEKYLKDLISRHKDDPRIFMWDLYNEPTNCMQHDRRKYAIDLMRKCFRWAREVGPSQPLTVASYRGNDPAFDAIVLAESDIITYHCYGNAAATRKKIAAMSVPGRPVICTEWLYRPNGCDIPNILPIHKETGVGSMLWGLVNGKAQTHLPNGGFTANYKGPWKHDLFHSDHRPYSVKDLDLIRKATRGVVTPWTCASGNAGRAMPDGTWLRRELKPGSEAFYLQTCNHPADSWGASGDTSVWRSFDAPEKGDYRLSFQYVGRPGMFGATTFVRVWKGEGTSGAKVLERTVRAMSDAGFVKYDAFVEIAEPGKYTVEFFQRQPEEMGVRTDKTIVIDNVEFVRDALFSEVKRQRKTALPAKYDVAALVYPGYQPDPRWQKELGIFHEGIGEWQNIKEAKPKWPGHYQPRRPVWGFENEADPKVMEKKIEAAASHGVNVFIYDWYWYGGRTFLEGGLHDGFLGARNNGKMQFFLMWANHNFGDGCNNKVSRKDDRVHFRGGVGPDDFRAMSRRVIDMYFSRPNYYRIAGKPVFMIYEVGTFVNGIGGMEKAAAALHGLDEDCRAAGLGGVHLMACSWNSCRAEHVAALGIESATMYTYAHHIYPQGDYATWADKGLAKLDAEKARLPGLKAYFGHVSIGWDTNPRYPETMRNVVNSTPDDFEKALRGVKDWCDRNTPAGYPRLISVNAWNEWIEGSYLEPDEKYGMRYLEAIHKVFR